VERRRPRRLPIASEGEGGSCKKEVTVGHGRGKKQEKKGMMGWDSGVRASERKIGCASSWRNTNSKQWRWGEKKHWIGLGEESRGWERKWKEERGEEEVAAGGRSPFGWLRICTFLHFIFSFFFSSSQEHQPGAAKALEIRCGF
jgi:hypothetical protein